MNNSIKKALVATTALSIALSGLAITPAFAKSNHNDNNNDNETEVKAHEENDVNFGLGLGKLGLGGSLSEGVFSTVSPDAIHLFKQNLKQAKKTEKTADKAAKVTLKASLQTAVTPADKKVAVKVYLNSLLAAFHAFAVAKEAAFSAFISSF